MFQVDYTEWKDTLEKYMEKLDKELAEIRTAKQELIDLQHKIQETALSGRYERDEDTLILSAPNIIIGNVDKNGNLLSGPSNIVVRGHNIELEGAGSVAGNSVTGGSVTTRARHVTVQTVDPGIDGVESVAFPDSSFTVQSAAVAFSAEVVDNTPSGGVFTLGPGPVMGCVNLNAETNINIVSECAIHDEDLEKNASEYEKAAKGFDKQAKASIKKVGENVKELKETQDNKLMNLIGAVSQDADTMAMRMGLYEFEDRRAKSERAIAALSENISDSTLNMSVMAEGNRVAKYLKERSKNLKSKKDKYAKEATGSSITIASERISMATTGADGKIRTCPGNGIFFKTQTTEFNTTDEAMKPLPNSSFYVFAHEIFVDSCDYTYEAKDDKLYISKAEAKGKIHLNAKEIDMSGLSATYELEGDKLKPKYTLAKGSHLNTNFCTTHIDMSDEEGKAQGIFMVNAKDVMINSYDVDKDNRVKPTGVSDGGKITIGAKEVLVGTVVKDMKSETIQIAAKNVNVLGEEKVDLQQEKDKSHLLLDSNAELSGSEIKVVGKINLGGETKIDAKFTAGDIEAKNVKASSSVTGPNLKDGIPIPAPAAPVQPGKGAELKELEALDKVREESEQNA